MITQQTLATLVKKYLANSQIVGTHENHQNQNLIFYQKRSQPNAPTAIVGLAQALQDAGNYLNHNNVLHGHARFLQIKSRLNVRPQAVKELVAAQQKFASCKDFASVHDATKFAINHIPGVGDLLVYDAALHISANLGFYPTEIYLHATPLKSAILLSGNPKIAKKGSAASLFPHLHTAFHPLAPHEIENFLCIYFGYFLWTVKRK
jgi:hypothetical protein